VQTPAVVKTLNDMEVDIIQWIETSPDFLFERGRGDITFGKFLEAALSLRAANRASVADIVDVCKLITKTDRKMREFVSDSMDAHFQLVRRELGDIRARLNSLDEAHLTVGSPGRRVVL